MNFTIPFPTFFSKEWNENLYNSSGIASRTSHLHSNKIETIFSGINFTQKHQEYKQERLNVVLVLILKITNFIFKKIGLNCSPLSRSLENHEHNCKMVHLIRKILRDIDFKQLKGPENVHYEKLLHSIFSHKKVDIESAFLS